MSSEILEISGVVDSPANVGLDAVVSEQQMNAHKVDAVSHSMDRALSQALHSKPGAVSDVSAVREEVMGGGEARLEKAAILADIDPSSVSVDKSELDKQMDSMVDRVRTLYGDLATWHVAWGVSHRVQQDTSQLLKGQ